MLWHSTIDIATAAAECFDEWKDGQRQPDECVDQSDAQELHNHLSILQPISHISLHLSSFPENTHEQEQRSQDDDEDGQQDVEQPVEDGESIDLIDAICSTQMSIEFDVAIAAKNDLHEQIEENEIEIDADQWNVMKEKFLSLRTKQMKMKDEKIAFESEDGFAPESAASEDVVEGVPDSTQDFTLRPQWSTSKETRQIERERIEWEMW